MRLNSTEEVKEFYEKVKTLGKGGFRNVWLGKAVGERKGHENGESDAVSANEYVAIKSVDTSTAMGLAFAKREADILKKLDHPHIVKLLNVFEVKNPPCTFLVITYASGPTLEKVLQLGGALGIPVAQSLSRQLINTVAYLHTNAVLHRDLKPDNVVITGSTLKDNFLWDDGEDGEKVVKDGRIHIMLLDFGFSRALQKEDIMTDLGLYKALEEDEKGTKFEFEENPTITKETHKDLNSSLSKSGNPVDRSGKDGRSQREQGSTLDESISHACVLDLSSLGNRFYAAPEVMSRVKDKPKEKPREMLNRSSRRGRRANKEALTDCVSDYGMDADAYSLGATLRYALTGVPPGNNVVDYIAAQNSVFRKFGSKLLKKMKKKKDSNKSNEIKQKKHYRTSSQCPKGATLLLRDLTSGDPIKRTTVRAARYYPWVMADDENENVSPSDSLILARKDNVTFLDIE